MLNRRQIATLAIGGSITLGIGAFYVIKDKTSLLLPKPLTCQTFPTKDPRFPSGDVKVCINGITQRFNFLNGDVDLDLMFQRGKHETVQADVSVWVADNINGRPVNYTGEMNFSRVRLYDGGILAVDIQQKFSGWFNPVVPPDVRVPLWKWIYGQRFTFDRTRLPLDEKFHEILKASISILSVAVSAGLTVWKVVKAQG
jgi:hypothetical protein